MRAPATLVLLCLLTACHGSGGTDSRTANPESRTTVAGKPNQIPASQPARRTKPMMKNEEGFEIVKTDKEWREQLTAEQFEVTRRDGTETARTGKYWNNKQEGTYVCVCCGHSLFSSETKFESGTGWPSFWKPIDEKHVLEQRDERYGMLRTEVSCKRCNAHLGHLFDDGPAPTGQRYCLNSASLDFKPKSK